MKRLFLHAPNVNVGGGGVLLRALIRSQNLGSLIANLDARAKSTLNIPPGAICYFVTPSVLARIGAEWRIARLSRDDDVVLCFHGLPPIFKVRGRVVVFKQNRLHLGSQPLSMFSGRTRLRLSLERLICKMFRKRVHEYIVQTPSMKYAVDAWHGDCPAVRIVPFLAAIPALLETKCHEGGEFIYVADGEAHKNHRILVAAWIELSSDGIFPPLLLTLPPRCDALWKEIEQSVMKFGLKITNLGTLTHDAMLERYSTSRALIFPSITESFGLPLLEASAAGLPIIASELDYVRDVCSPDETFDPHSSRSIAAAVKRFLKIETLPLRMRTPEEFLCELVHEHQADIL